MTRSHPGNSQVAGVKGSVKGRGAEPSGALKYQMKKPAGQGQRAKVGYGLDPPKGRTNTIRAAGGERFHKC